VIKPGDSIVSQINNGLQNSDFVLLVISAKFLRSNWASWESNASIVHAIKVQRSVVIPILLEDVWNDVPPLVRDKLYVDFRNHSNLLEYRSCLKRLLSVLSIGVDVRIQKMPVITVTGGRNPNFQVAFTVAYELGRLLGSHSYRIVTGVAQGVDEHFARGAAEGLQAQKLEPRNYLTAYSTKNLTLAHSLGKILNTRFGSREEGVPEMVSEADIVILMGGSKNTNYFGVLSLLESKVVLPVEYTGGAASDLYSLCISRYQKVFGSLLSKNRFEDLADRSRTPREMASICFELVRFIGQG
jgi:TIR domain/Sir2- and TIR-associating SLOG family